MAKLRPLFEATCWVRYLDGWQRGRQALENDGIVLEACVFYYVGPGGTFATVGFVGELGNAVGIDLDRETSDGSVRIGERWSWDNIEDREKDAAKEIWKSGQLEWFNMRVKEYFQQHYSEGTT